MTATAHLSSDLTSLVATLPFAVAALVIVLGLPRALAHPRHAGSSFASSLALGVEFFLAAGLIRLASAQDFETLGVVATIIAARRVIGLGVRYGARAAG